MFIAILLDTTEPAADAVFAAVAAPTEAEALELLKAEFVEAWTYGDVDADPDDVWDTMVCPSNGDTATHSFVYTTIQTGA